MPLLASSSCRQTVVRNARNKNADENLARAARHPYRSASDAATWVALLLNPRTIETRAFPTPHIVPSTVHLHNASKGIAYRIASFV